MVGSRSSSMCLFGRMEIAMTGIYVARIPRISADH